MYISVGPFKLEDLELEAFNSTAFCLMALNYWCFYLELEIFSTKAFINFTL